MLFIIVKFSYYLPSAHFDISIWKRGLICMASHMKRIETYQVNI